MRELPAIQWPLISKCVWWPIASYNAYNEPVFASPITIRCRWDDDNQEALQKTGETFISRAIVMTDRKIEEGVLSHIRMSEVDSTKTPFQNKGWLIRANRVTPDPDGQEALYEVFL